jgi:hypothetical protein
MEPWGLALESWRLKKPGRVCRPLLQIRINLLRIRINKKNVESGSTAKWKDLHRVENPNPDPDQSDADPQHWLLVTNIILKTSRSGAPEVYVANIPWSSGSRVPWEPCSPGSGRLARCTFRSLRKKKEQVSIIAFLLNIFSWSFSRLFLLFNPYTKNNK